MKYIRIDSEPQKEWDWWSDEDRREISIAVKKEAAAETLEKMLEQHEEISRELMLQTMEDGHPELEPVHKVIDWEIRKLGRKTGADYLVEYMYETSVPKNTEGTHTRTHEELVAIHKLSFRSRRLIESSTRCGCFFCQKIYPKKALDHADWTDDNETPICPFCDIDSVLAETDELKLTPELLGEMYDKFFQVTTGAEEVGASVHIHAFTEGGSEDHEDNINLILPVSDEATELISQMLAEKGEALNQDDIKVAIEAGHDEWEGLYEYIQNIFSEFVAKNWLHEEDRDMIDETLYTSFWKDVKKGIYKPSKSYKEYVRGEKSYDGKYYISYRNNPRTEYYEQFCYGYLTWVNSHTDDCRFIAERVGLDPDAVKDIKPKMEFTIDKVIKREECIRP